MKKFCKLLCLASIMEISVLNVVSCSENKIIFEEETDMLNMADIENKIKDPVPNELKLVYINEVKKIFSNFNSKLEIEKNYKIIVTGDFDDFRVGDQVYIKPVEENGEIFGKIINKSVNFLSIAQFQLDLESVIPVPGEEKSKFEKILIDRVEDWILGSKFCKDFYFEFKMQKELIFSKGDVITILSIPSSDFLTGSALLKINIFDINDIDYDNVKPLINEEIDDVIIRIEQKISDYVFESEIGVDFKISHFSENKKIRDGDVIEIKVLPSSRLLIGVPIKFKIETFNLIDLKSEIGKIDFSFKTNIDLFLQSVDLEILTKVPKARRGIDYKIECNNQYEFFIPGDEIEISIFENSHYLVGEPLRFQIPQIDLSILEDSLREIEIIPGLTKYDEFKSEVDFVLNSFSPYHDITDEIKIFKSDSDEIIYSDTTIKIEPKKDSIFFKNDSDMIEIKNSYLKVDEIYEFISPIINLSAGSNFKMIKDLIIDLLKTSTRYSTLKIDVDYEVTWSSVDEYLKLEDSFGIKANKDSRLLVGEPVDWFATEFEIEKLILELQKIELSPENSDLENNKIIKDCILINASFMKENVDYKIEWSSSPEKNIERGTKDLNITFYSGKWIEKETILEINL
ncbi:hypothetical protein [Spiroplasma alleghenense]|uniref:Uncharacterized protein n=1 Tax=Spiroplasma alleghenense TaxID=216931 RepID=A0A345Z4Z4_9MOLU|nr:hypothetical protein [Spiroplasma alleghenense]AXK51673.1 hypothetical protein SALLE_v1c10030 [Spiroplasma alleghenense]